MALPEPQGGLVISYSYLWRHERAAGQVEGVKSRPCAIVLAVRREGESGLIVTVAPITHSPLHDPTDAIEIPERVKRHLGLDGERSWIILDDLATRRSSNSDICKCLAYWDGKHDFVPGGIFPK
jgi:hypothetical protein